MKTIRYILFLSFFAALFQAADAQKRFPTTDGVTQQQMEGKFCIPFDNSQSRSFYAVDMNFFTDAAAARHFQQAIYKDDKLVCLSAPGDAIWYLSGSSQNAWNEINDKINGMKDAAVSFAASLTNEKRNDYLSGNKK